MMHPGQTELALFAGHDLRLWESWRIGRHVARCAHCRQQVESVRQARRQLRLLAEQTTDLPPGFNWDRLAAEMTGNIRVGLAAGQAIALFDKPLRRTPRLGWRAALIGAGATIIFAVAFWTSLPPQQAGNLIASLRRIRTERIGVWVHSGTGSYVRPEDVVLEASSSSIEVKENGRALSLMPRSDGATVSVSMPGSAGIRFVDTDTGQVTTNKVYYAEQ